MCEVVALDLWDTLIYLPDGWRTFTLLKAGLPKEREFWRQKVKPYYLLRQQESAAGLLGELREGLGYDLSMYMGAMCAQLEYDLANIRLYPEVLSVLARIRKTGRRLAIVSNQCTLYKPWFYEKGLDEWFECVLFSCDLGIGKPDARIYSELARAMAVRPSAVLFVGDNVEHDYEKPKQLGFRALHLQRQGIAGGGVITSLSDLSAHLGY